MTDRFHDRRAAGVYLAGLLDDLAGDPALIVLGLPRGGVPVAFEVAQRLRAPLDVLVVRKLGMPGQPELAIGALAAGVRLVDDNLIALAGISDAALDAITARAQIELGRQEGLYRAGKPPLDLHDRTVVLVDDGLATGSTMLAAVSAARAHAPRRVIVAVPTGARQACAALRAVADEVVCARMPEPFDAVGAWYQHFQPTSDDEVRELLARAGPSGTVERARPWGTVERARRAPEPAGNRRSGRNARPPASF